MRKTWVLAGAAVLAVATATSGVAVMSGAKQATAAARQLPVGTAQVERRTLSAMVSQAGILTYRARSDGSPYSVINQARGTYTKLPASGQVISQGHVLYRVNYRPVVLLHGSTPAYRTLSAGASGPDVAELNADLVALGYATRAQLSPKSASFGPATTAAVERLQAALGVPPNGTLTLGQAVFEPAAVRLTAPSAQLGVSAQTGQAVLRATSTTRQVHVALSASEQTSMAVGDKVSITLPNNRTSPGVVSSVATVATCPSSSGLGASGSSSVAPGTDTCSSGSSGSSSTPTIAVDVTPSHPAATGRWDQAPVQVGITTASVPNALVVPVTALLARSGGGYAVEVVGAGATNHLVGVSLGLFDDAEGLVQVTASALAAGQEVVVPEHDLHPATHAKQQRGHGRQ
jgi:peptidoglycan hydrolase-like protein with peptidoglycan-binding domain